MNKDRIHKNRKEDWETPPEIFDRLNAFYSFTIDLAANERSRKVDRFVGPGSIIAEDFLTVPPGVLLNERCFINPPYGKYLAPFTKRISELSVFGIKIVALLPASVDTKWFWDYVQPIAVCYFRRGRIQFLPKGIGGNPGPSLLAEFNFQELMGRPGDWRLI